jgi:hypothetical protein
MVMPGDNVQMTVELITPIAMEKGLRFAIREGGRTVGAGVVTEISRPPAGGTRPGPKSRRAPARGRFGSPRERRIIPTLSGVMAETTRTTALDFLREVRASRCRR